jgi:predicted transcriptional regulator
MPNNKTKKESAGKKSTARLLRERLGKAPSENVSRVQAHNRVRKRIVESLGQGPQTVPEITESTGLPGHEVLWHLMAMKKYGKLAEGQQRGDYYEYALIEEQENQE